MSRNTKAIWFFITFNKLNYKLFMSKKMSLTLKISNIKETWKEILRKNQHKWQFIWTINRFRILVVITITRYLSDKCYNNYIILFQAFITNNFSFSEGAKTKALQGDYFLQNHVQDVLQIPKKHEYLMSGFVRTFLLTDNG